MPVNIDTRACFHAIGAAMTLAMAACSTASFRGAGEGAQQNGTAVCDAAMIDNSSRPPRRLSSPTAKWLSPPDMRVVVQTLTKAAPDTSHPIPEACGAIRFLVAMDGTVQNVTVLAEYPAGHRPWRCLVEIHGASGVSAERGGRPLRCRYHHQDAPQAAARFVMISAKSQMKSTKISTTQGSLIVKT